jgi:replicative DNA helicase
VNDLPSWDEAAEQAVLGAMLLSAKAITEVSEVVSPEDFYRPAHRLIFGAVLATMEEGQPVDQVTVLDYLSTRGLLAKVGGGPYLHTLMERVPTAVNGAYYAEIVARHATLRRLAEAGQRIMQLAYVADGEDVDEVVERARAELDKLVVARNTGDTAELEDLLPDAIEQLARPIKPGHPTGFADLDKVLGGGLHPGTVTIIGARPGVGKSILCLQIAAHIAASGHGALVHSLEMSRWTSVHHASSRSRESAEG